MCNLSENLLLAEREIVRLRTLLHLIHVENALCMNEESGANIRTILAEHSDIEPIYPFGSFAYQSLLGYSENGCEEQL